MTSDAQTRLEIFVDQVQELLHHGMVVLAKLDGDDMAIPEVRATIQACVANVMLVECETALIDAALTLRRCGKDAEDEIEMLRRAKQHLAMGITVVEQASESRDVAG